VRDGEKLERQRADDDDGDEPQAKIVFFSKTPILSFIWVIY
jgi:hypothetical protein